MCLGWSTLRDMFNLYAPQLVFQSYCRVSMWGCCTLFICAPKIKVLDPRPTRSGVFSDKGQIMPIAAQLWAVEPGHFALTNSDDSNANEMRRTLGDGAKNSHTSQ